MNRKPARGSVWLAAVVLAHLVLSVVHGTAHDRGHIELAVAANLFVYIVILAGPLLGLLLMWRNEWIGSWLIAVTMAGSLVFGLVNHFAVPGPDHVAYVAPEVRLLFGTTAGLLALTEATAVGFASRMIRASRRS